MSKQKTFLSKNSNATAVSAKTSLRASATSWRIWSRKRQKSALAGNRRVESEFVTLRGTRCQVSVAAAAAFEWKLDETESSQFRNRPKKAARQRVRENFFERSYARKAKSTKVWNSFAEKNYFWIYSEEAFSFGVNPAYLSRAKILSILANIGFFKI